jgi:hypothetical protein
VKKLMGEIVNQGAQPSHRGELGRIALLLGVDGRAVGRVKHVESEEHLHTGGYMSEPR